MLGKTKKYLYNFCFYIKSLVIFPINKIKTLHQLVLQMDELAIQESDEKKNPYQMLSAWLIDVLTFGVICLVLYVAFFGWHPLKKSIILIFGFGMIPTILRYIRDVILGN